MARRTDSSIYSKGWEDAYRQASGHEESLWQEQPIEFLPEKLSMLQSFGVRTILDAGCGDGRNLLFMAQRGLICTGLDISPLALKKANRKLRQVNASATFVIADLVELPVPFLEGIFDAVACLDVFGQIADTPKLVTGIRSVLADGGYFLGNLYTPEDETFGEGVKIAPNTFEYQGVLFKFFRETDILGIFDGLQILEVERMRWEDPPHRNFRPVRHIHDSFVVIAKKP